MSEKSGRERAFFLKFRASIVFSMVFASSVVLSCSATLSHLPPRDVNDNITQINAAASRLFQRIESNLEAGRPVYFTRTESTSPAQHYLDNAFQEYLSKRGWTLFRVPADVVNTPPGEARRGYAVVLDAQSIHVGYKTNKNSGKRSGKKLSREITVQVFCNIIDLSNGAVIAARTLSEHLEDEIYPREIAMLQDTEFPFARAEPPEPGRLRDLIEMGTVLSAAGVIIFLLFSTRS